MKKDFPDFKTDADAEAFVETADLADYDFSGMTRMRFERAPKNKAISLRLPESLLDEIRERADRAGIPAQRFIRMAIERALAAKS